MKKFLLKRLLPVIKLVIRGELETVKDSTGTYIKIKIFVLDEVVLNRLIYLSRNDSDELDNQLIKIK